MLVCFTIGELYAFAKKLQVPETPSWSNNPQEAARDIVRHFERSGALAFLVEGLRETKPLVEWPEPLPLPVPPAPPLVAAPAAAPRVAPTVITDPAASPGDLRASPPRGQAPAGAGGGVGGGATVLGVPAPHALEFADTALESPTDTADRATPIADVPEAMLAAASHRSTPPQNQTNPAAPPGFAPAIMPRPGEPAASPPAFSPAPSRPAAPPPVADTMPASLRVSPAAAEAPRAAWPATRSTSAAPPAKTPPDPRVLMGVGAGILLVLIGVAFLAGRASSSTASASGSTSGTSGGAAEPGDQVAIAQNAADALGTSLLRVAKACQIDPGTLRGKSLFEVAYRRCGPLPQQPNTPRIPGLPDIVPDPDPQAPLDPVQPQDPQPVPGKKGKNGGTTRPTPAPDPAPGQPNTSGSGCLSGCSRSHGACTSKCGAEPQAGSQYDAYQSCLSGCLKALSQCKMGCQ